MTNYRGVLQSRQTTVAMLNRACDAAVIFICSMAVSYYCLGDASEVSYLASLVAVVAFYAICEIQQFYISWRTTPFRMEASKLLMNWTFAFFLSLGFESFVGFELTTSPLQAVAWYLSIAFGLLAYRLLLKTSLRKAREHGFNTRQIAIVGAGRLGQDVAHRIQASPWMGYNIVGFYDTKDYTDESHELKPANTKGTIDDMVREAKQGAFDKVYIALPFSHQKLIADVIAELADTSCTVCYLPDVFTFELLHARADNLGGLPVISIYSSPMDGSNRIVKRAFDLICGSLILALISIPMLCIAAAVKLTSKGPVFFKQNRYGIDGKPIQVWKFRSMTVMEDGDVVTQAKKRDSRLTPIGGFLRRTSLDELPQFINVVQGSMSIVGPRPHAIAHNEQYRKLINGYMLRHLVKPGITGWAQINGWRGETDTLDKMEMRVKYDLEYIQNWSVMFDTKILFLTVFKGFVDKNAY
ncbi:undecaprenyl-phosphate glucose phosphotransferase [Vibrio mediterranei]|uniref:undecaprenyl-phosphate glucose phosphotransferase n=1 Tax=Vibrio mediterranei TaxID=689 RepID=UPI0016BBCCF6|nr:undecaprenyl-phosphate glucose phosphotransferase [Vibrio mediterranei]NOH29040.1 undecaprenyl-phosphate glucose phosphotransferase [Vibrio mediterranei]